MAHKAWPDLRRFHRVPERERSSLSCLQARGGLGACANESAHAHFWVLPESVRANRHAPRTFVRFSRALRDVHVASKQACVHVYMPACICARTLARISRLIFRTLAYSRTEMRFYSEFAAELAARGVRVPRLAAGVDNLDHLLGESAVADAPGAAPDAEHLRGGGGILLLECVDARLEQRSPVSFGQAAAALRTVAGMHAAAWEDTALLQRAAERLQRHGGSFSLSIRNPAELTKLRPNWERFVGVFAPCAPGLFGQERILQLGERLEAVSSWVAGQLAVEPSDRFATLVHGDLKAMNLFLPAENPATASGAGEAPAGGGETGTATDTGVAIDFASTGVGYGMADVAMFLSHSVAPDTLADGGEEALLRIYVAALAQGLRARGRGGSDSQTGDSHADASAAAGALQTRGCGGLSYGPGAGGASGETLMRQYRMGVVDYGRFVVSRFWGDASPDVFLTKVRSSGS